MNCAEPFTQHQRGYNRRPLHSALVKGGDTILDGLSSLTSVLYTPVVASKKAGTRYMCELCARLLTKILKNEKLLAQLKIEFRERTQKDAYVGKKVESGNITHKKKNVDSVI